MGAGPPSPTEALSLISCCRRMATVAEEAAASLVESRRTQHDDLLTCSAGQHHSLRADVTSDDSAPLITDSKKAQDLDAERSGRDSVTSGARTLRSARCSSRLRALISHVRCTIHCSEEVVRVASGTLAGSSDQRPGSGPISTASHRALVRAAPRWLCMQLFSLLCR